MLGDDGEVPEADDGEVPEADDGEVRARMTGMTGIGGDDLPDKRG